MIFLRAFLAGTFALVAVLLLERYMLLGQPEPVRCDGGEEGSTPLVDAIRKDAFIADLEKRLEKSAALQDLPLPEWFDKWVEEWNRKNQ